jgi:hypothetical protein
VISLASMHGLLPLLHRHLREYSQEPGADGATSPSKPVPAEVARHLQSDFNVAVAGNLFLTAELINILRQLAAQDIPVLCYKGPSLAVLAYGNLLLRPFNDLDLLLQRHDLQRAEAVLTQWDTGSVSTATWKPTNTRTACLVKWVPTRPKPWSSCTGASRRATRRCLCRWKPSGSALRRWICAAQKLPVPAREELILLLCCHGYKHRWERIEWISGIASLLAGETPSTGAG